MAAIKLSTEELATLGDGIALLEKVGMTMGEGDDVKIVLTCNPGPDPVWDAVRTNLTNDEITTAPVKLYMEYPATSGTLFLMERRQLTFGHAFNVEVRTDDGLYHTVYLHEHDKLALVPADSSVFLAHEEDQVGHDSFEDSKQSSGITKESGVADSTIIKVLHEGGDLFEKDPAEFHAYVEEVSDLPSDVIIVVYSAGSISEYVLACKNGPEAAYRWLANKMEWYEDEILPDSTTMTKAEYEEFLTSYNS